MERRKDGEGASDSEGKGRRGEKGFNGEKSEETVGFLERSSVAGPRSWPRKEQRRYRLCRSCVPIDRTEQAKQLLGVKGRGRGRAEPVGNPLR